LIFFSSSRPISIIAADRFAFPFGGGGRGRKNKTRNLRILIKRYFNRRNI